VSCAPTSVELGVRGESLNLFVVWPISEVWGSALVAGIVPLATSISVSWG
jgi:hypothetical protein